MSLFWLEVENFGEIAISQMFLVKAYPSWEKPPKETIEGWVWILWVDKAGRNILKFTGVQGRKEVILGREKPKYKETVLWWDY